MRLSEQEQKVIKDAVLSLDDKAKVYLFGSRVDDKKKGGDIDILVVSEKLTYSDRYPIYRNIFNHLEEQKIDLVIAKDLNESAFVNYIYDKAVPL